MISIEQKTDYWIIGALQRLVQVGLLRNFKIKREISLEENHVDWNELDKNFMSWANQTVFLKTAQDHLTEIHPFLQEVLLNNLVAFSNPNLRYQMMQLAYENLFMGYQNERA